jgi:hypothetical protein
LKENGKCKEKERVAKRKLESHQDGQLAFGGTPSAFKGKMRRESFAMGFRQDK